MKILMHTQNLICNKQSNQVEHELLKDDCNTYLWEYCKCNAPAIKIADKSIVRLQIFIKTIDNKIFTLEMEHSNKIKDVKMKIQEKTKLFADQQNLIYQGEILADDDKTIDQYRICENTVIDIVARLRGGMQIFAKTMDGKSFTLEVERTDKIIDVKKNIQCKIGLHRDEQRLVYGGRVLDDDKTIGEYQICDKSVINIVNRLRGGMQIFAKTMDGKTVAFEVQKTERIIDVKYKFQEKLGLSPDKQKLLSRGGILYDNEMIILENDKTIDHYQIADKSVINVVAILRGGMQIYAKTMNGKTVFFEVQKRERVSDIKKKIQEKIGLHPDEQKLVYQGGILDDDKTIDEYQIAEKSVINIVARLRPDGIQIFAKTLDGKTVAFDVVKSERIIDVKYKIQERIGLYPDEQKLIYQGGILDDDNKTIDEYQICVKSVINVVARLIMQIFAKTSDGKLVTIEVNKSDKIIDVKYKIQDKTGLHPNEQELFYQDEILENDKTIREYQICEKSIINIIPRLRNEIQIFIKTSNKSIIPINIVKTSKIIDVKSKIAEKTGMQIEINNLIYENKILDDDKLLIDYHIGDGCVITIDGDRQFFLFMKAIKSGSIDKVQSLNDSKFHEIRNSPMHYACKLNNADIVEFLIKSNFKINAFDDEYNMPIHYACINDSIKILETLIQNKCNIEVCNAHRMKPIHLACLHGNFQNLKLLIENHCDLEPQDYMGRRPIHLACLAGNIDIVKLLIENKCEIDVIDKSNKSPFDIAKKENRFDIIEIIDEEMSRRMIENMISKLDLKCHINCDHKFCQTSLRNKTFNKGVKIRKGVTGKVYQYRLSQSSRKIAIKQIPKDKIDSGNIEGNINRFIEKINHERIIKYFGAITKMENIFIFMEFMSRSLRSQISTNPLMISSKIIHYIKQILEGLKFVHSKKIIHRNIKPDHILLDNDENVKLTDFGLGLSLWATDSHTTQAAIFGGTTHYMAPEIINGEQYSYGIDIWSLGVTVIEMATGKCPFQELSHQNVAVKIGTTKTIPYQLPASSPINMKLFIDQILIPEPSRRPSATDLINKLETMKWE